MLAPYSKDLCWKAIFLAEILDLELKQVKKNVYVVHLHENYPQNSLRAQCSRCNPHNVYIDLDNIDCLNIPYFILFLSLQPDYFICRL